MKKLLSLSDLYNFYVIQNKNVNFSSKDSDRSIVIHIEEPYKFEKNEVNDELILKTHLRLCHTDLNLNGSFISKDTMKDALPTVYNMPILGYIWHDSNDDLDKFAGHEFYEDESGEVIYQEIPLGIIPESADLQFVEDKENNKTYLEGDGLIWRTYTKAAEILEREEELSCSVEIQVDDLSYDAKNKVLVLNAIRFTGVTILEARPGSGEEIKPGMQGAKISIEDFSAKNNSIFSQEDITQVIQEAIKEAFADIKNSERKEEKDKVNKELFEKLLAQYSKTAEDIEFDYSEMDDDALTKAFAEAFEDENDPSSEENVEDPSNDAEVEPTGAEDLEGTDDTEESAGESSVEDSTFSVTFTRNDNTVTFAKSLNEEISAVTELVNLTYGETDNAWYSCEVYDDKTVFFHDWWMDKHFKQKYSVKEGVYSLKGDRTEVFAKFLTQEECDALDGLKAKYEEASAKLQKYEEEPEKMAILNSADYTLIAEKEEFVAMKSQEAHFDMSIDEVRAKADSILLEAAKNDSSKFSVTDTGKSQYSEKRIPINTKSKKTKRYGNLFSKAE